MEINEKLAVRVNSLLHQGGLNGIHFTPFHLQKLLYLYYGEHIKECDEELPELDFEAWTYGPVIPSLYQNYKRYGSNEIHQMIPYEGSFYRLEDELIQERAVRKYGKKTFEELIQLTHRRDGAWDKAYFKGRGHRLEFSDIKSDFRNWVSRGGRRKVS